MRELSSIHLRFVVSSSAYEWKMVRFRFRTTYLCTVKDLDDVARMRGNMSNTVYRMRLLFWPSCSMEL